MIGRSLSIFQSMLAREEEEGEVIFAIENISQSSVRHILSEPTFIYMAIAEAPTKNKVSRAAP
jgi:hypothetical protein